jgi:15-cis-phytoene synthase
MSNQKQLFDVVSAACSRITTQSYSTSFSLGIKALGFRFRQPIYNIYGFVRFADEIVDTFHEYDKATLMARFRQDTVNAIHDRISLNPILNSFQAVYHEYGIEWELVDTFLKSMEMDLHQTSYERGNYENYILGSAEVVGLMCLRVFTENDDAFYQRLKPHAMSLGAAFQKINFLRDLKQDYQELGRAYFPGTDFSNFTLEQKRSIESEILDDFNEGYKGILMLPKDARFGVFMAYKYYLQLFEKICRLDTTTILTERVRIPNTTKWSLMMKSYVVHNLNML